MPFYRKKKNAVMPRRKKRYTRKSKYPKRNSGYRNYLKRDTGLLPQGKVVSMRFNLTKTLVSTSGIEVHNTLRINSVYDPDKTGLTGTQPLGFDQYGLYYGSYTVLGAKVVTTFRWANLASVPAADQIPVLCYSFPDDDTSVDTALLTKVERYPGLVKYLSPDPRSVVTLVNYYSTKKFWNVKDITADHQLHGAFTGNPSKEAFINQGIQATSANTAGAVLMDTVIQFSVRLNDPKELLPS